MEGNLDFHSRKEQESRCFAIKKKINTFIQALQIGHSRSCHHHHSPFYKWKQWETQGSAVNHIGNWKEPCAVQKLMCCLESKGYNSPLNHRGMLIKHRWKDVFQVLTALLTWVLITGAFAGIWLLIQHSRLNIALLLSQGLQKVKCFTAFCLVNLSTIKTEQKN